MESINIRFPLKDDPIKNTYFQLNQITKDAFSSNLLLLLLTERGERFYQPDYGTNLLKYIFEPNDDLTSQDVEEEIKNTVSQYLPNLIINRVTFNKSEGETQLNVHIEFTYREDAFSESGELDLNF
jgi:phage baseplate assembly protein W